MDYAWDADFEKFINNAIEMFPGGAVSTFYKCFLGENGDTLDFVGKQENLTEDFIKALTLAGEDFDEKKIREMKRINVKDSDIPTKISDDLRERLEAVEKWTINKFYKK